MSKVILVNEHRLTIRDARLIAGSSSVDRLWLPVLGVSLGFVSIGVVSSYVLSSIAIVSVSRF